MTMSIGIDSLREGRPLGAGLRGKAPRRREKAEVAASHDAIAVEVGRSRATPPESSVRGPRPPPGCRRVARRATSAACSIGFWSNRPRSRRPKRGRARSRRSGRRCRRGGSPRACPPRRGRAYRIHRRCSRRETPRHSDGHRGSSITIPPVTSCLRRASRRPRRQAAEEVKPAVPSSSKVGTRLGEVVLPSISGRRARRRSTRRSARRRSGVSRQSMFGPLFTVDTTRSRWVPAGRSNSSRSIIQLIQPPVGDRKRLHESTVEVDLDRPQLRRRHWPTGVRIAVDRRTARRTRTPPTRPSSPRSRYVAGPSCPVLGDRRSGPLGRLHPCGIAGVRRGPRLHQQVPEHEAVLAGSEAERVRHEGFRTFVPQ